MQDVYITTGYLGHLLRSFCGDGTQWNMRILYTQEIEPLGTIGPLSLLRDDLTEPFLVLNGDILTDLSLNQFVGFHHKHCGPLTIATTVRSLKMDFGVIDEQEGSVKRFREKPTLAHLVSMGLYCMNPTVFEFIPTGVPFGFDDLILQMLESGEDVHVFRHEGLWLDIGRVEDFQSAQDIAWDELSASIEAVSAA
ncbi:mannose-1-phosphate guanylyltransferase [Mycoplana sp. BE70]|nr:mannose-1-phosphate guanylyltransferase [Mycoplana sp. BE70]